MPHSVAKLLYNMIEAGRAVPEFVADRSLTEYREDLMRGSAVERQFEILGETMNRLDRVDPDLLERIDGHQEIIAFRNVIPPGYDALDDAIVGHVITDYPPMLVSQAEELLQEVSNLEGLGYAT